MIGFLSIFLLVIAFASFFSKRRHLVLIIISVLATSYFSFAPQSFYIGNLSLQHGDLALLLIFSLIPFQSVKLPNQLRPINKAIWMFFLFLFVAIMYDYFNRPVTILQIFRTTRLNGYLAIFFILGSFSKRDLINFLRFISITTAIHSVLYLSQYLFGLNLGSEPSIESGGITRFGNSPIFLLPVFVILLFTQKSKLVIKNQFIIQLLLVVFIIVAIFTIARGLILAMMVSLFAYLFFMKYLKQQSLVFITLITIPIIIFWGDSEVSDLLQLRFSDGLRQLNELNTVDFNNYSSLYHQGSFIFRLGIFYERFIYVIQDPVYVLLGVGFTPDIDLVNPVFVLGTESPSLPVGYEQYNTGDILFPNLITRYGILGSIIFLNIILKLFLYAKRNLTLLWGRILFSYLISMMLISFINNSFYNTMVFIMTFLMLTLSVYESIIQKDSLNTQ